MSVKKAKTIFSEEACQSSCYGYATFEGLFLLHTYTIRQVLHDTF